ncbi:PoNe immunity protein domain-containing protein [Algibacter sp. 2305UL17-15]|uniref:PoNe immunity protein domain-containing protein n=1 Tax=Algibacter sp. 2305UL17-15 TaxID=3231268 RepID=UPI003459F3CD
MRDLLKNKTYFENYIKNSCANRKALLKKIEKQQISRDRVSIVMRSLADSSVQLCISKYSAGYSLVDIRDSYFESIDLIYKSWDGFWKLKIDNEVFNQYTVSPYQEMLTMLSIGYLLNIPNEKFQLLVDVIDRDHVKDKLFEFIIAAKMPSRKPLESESYKKYFGIPDIFKTLRQIIDSKDKDEASLLMANYLNNEWYNIQAETGIKDIHNSRHDIYYGYWSFESAAIVKIMDLDDSSFINNQYYPKDLVHQLPESDKKKGWFGKLGF